MSVTTVLAELATIADGISGMKYVHSAGATGKASDGSPGALPEGISGFPAAMLYPGEMIELVQGPGTEVHSYIVRLDVFMSQAGDFGTRNRDAIAFVDDLRSALRPELTMGSVASWGVLIVSWRYGSLEYAGEQFTGYAIELRVSERDSVTDYATGD